MFYLYRSGASSDFSDTVRAYGIDCVAGDGLSGVRRIARCPERDLCELAQKHRILIDDTVDISKPVEMGYPMVEIAGAGEKLLNGDFEPVSSEFFRRDAAIVARELLGKLIVRRWKDRVLLGKIVETEAYYGARDPASRAYHGKKEYNRGMWLPGGHVFVYMVHANWMLNITADGDEAEAVLIRALEPLAGLDIMRLNRGREKIRDLCSGPGKLSQALGIVRDLNEKPLGDALYIANSPWAPTEIVKTHRIGVKKDMDIPLRFYMANSRFVSRK